MKTFVASSIFAFVLAAVSFAQPAGTPAAQAKTEQEVRAAIEKYRTALVKRDAAALEQIWTDDYIFINGHGEVASKAQRLANLKSGATSLGAIDEGEKIVVRVYGNTAIATSRVAIKGQYNGKTTSGQYRSMHVWVRGESGWQLIANQLTPVRA